METDAKGGSRKPKKRVPKEKAIYNCHIHIFTKKNVPRYFLRYQFDFILGTVLSITLRWNPIARLISWISRHPYWFARLESLHRYARFILTGNLPSKKILERIQRQYPKSTVFVVLPMDMAFMNTGDIEESIEIQHKQLLELTQDKDLKDLIVPFYAVDPRRPDIVERVRENVTPQKFRGVKIYPNLGYYPNDKTLMQVYEICQEQNVPVMTHCSAGGVWKYPLKQVQRAQMSHPHNYREILEQFPNLRLCLAHYGSASDWERHLKGRAEPSKQGEPWVAIISNMISEGSYPNLYTDISMTLFFPKPPGLYFDFFDYLKVLLSNSRIREHVLFGSDYFMLETASLSEKQVSLGLRSRLGEELYFQIAHYNPRRYLGLPRSGD